MHPDLTPRKSQESVELFEKIEELRKNLLVDPYADMKAEVNKEKAAAQELLDQENRNEKQHRDSENARVQAITEGYAAQLSALKQDCDKNLWTAKEVLLIFKTKLNEANQALEIHQDAVSKFERTMAALTIQKQTNMEKIREATAKMAAANDDISTAEEGKKVIKSYLSCAFEDALDGLGNVATQLIRGIPNMSTATIQFDGIKENKDGKIKEEVNPVISMDGEVGIPIRSLSGGERSSADMAVDLAVIQFIEAVKFLNMYLNNKGLFQ